MSLCLALHAGAQDTPVALTAAEIGDALFYSVPGAAADRSFAQHADHIGTLAPQSFALDRNGVLKGAVPADLLAAAASQGVAVMPLVINAGFSRTNGERLLRSPRARDRAIGALVTAAREQGFSGWQIDFENLPSSQRAAFSRFVAETAEALHRQGKQLSVAVAARTADLPGSDNFRSFSGVYDYAALGASADFLSVMAYPESDASHPGPLASYPWVERVVRHVLEAVPPDKVSLGLPTYQTDWMERRVRISFRRRVAGHIKRVFAYVYRLFHRNGPVVHDDDTPLEWDAGMQSSYRITGSGHKRQVTW
ncbi:MAG TPA: glycosyl hydrolase family 18 protein, partial [Terriglobales bacterium]|nr:glycosyl hydrolase family 18 protein [Terriglobales bacterium]